MIGHGDVGANLGPSGGGRHRLAPLSLVDLMRGARKDKKLLLDALERIDNHTHGAGHNRLQDAHFPSLCWGKCLRADVTDATMPCRCALSALIVTRSVKVAALHACAPYPRDWAAFGHRPPCQPRLQPNRAGGVLTEERALPDIAAKHRRALVTRLVGDDAPGAPGSGSRGRKACPQRVTSNSPEIMPIGTDRRVRCLRHG